MSQRARDEAVALLEACELDATLDRNTGLGEVFTDDTLVIGEGAIVEATIDVGEVIIQGTVIGNITAKRSIEIHAPGHVKGDLHTPSLQVDKGVMFEGRSFMEQSVANRPAAQPAAQAAKPTPVK